MTSNGDVVTGVYMIEVIHAFGGYLLVETHEYEYIAEKENL